MYNEQLEKEIKTAEDKLMSFFKLQNIKRYMTEDEIPGDIKIKIEEIFNENITYQLTDNLKSDFIFKGFVFDNKKILLDYIIMDGNVVVIKQCRFIVEDYKRIK